MERLFLLLNSIAKMSPDLEAYLKKVLKRVEFKKGQIILKEGKYPWRGCIHEVS